MTGPDQGPPSDPQRPPGEDGGVSVTLVAIVLLVVSAAALFWAGLSLGSQMVGRDADEQAAIEAFAETYRRITDEYVGGSEPDELLQGAIEGMFEVLDDPYSRYMGPDEYDTVFDDINGEFEGIGARMNTEDDTGVTCQVISEDCRLRVVEPLQDTPAEQAGLAGGDIVTAVDGRPLDGGTIDDAVEAIKGPRGSDVTLSLERDGEALRVTITRDLILTRDVRADVLADGAVGYLRIDSFSTRSAGDFETALRGQLDSGVDKVIVDVRGDPGGFVDAAVEITSEFLAEGPVFWEEDAAGERRPIEATDGGLATDPDIEVVLLVDDGTASASEILAGALQDAGRARLVGERTFGKGTVQEWTQLPGEQGGFRLSVAKWLTRDEAWIDGVGLVPDELVAGDGHHFRPGDPRYGPADDLQLQHAIELLVGEEPGTFASPAT